MEENKELTNEQTPVEETPVTEQAPQVEAPVEAPVETTPEPVAESTPVEAPVESAPSVPAEPVTPVQEAPVAPTAPVQPTPEKKGCSPIFIIVVIFLILAIIGLGIAVVVLVIGNNNNGSGNTTTQSTTVTEGTSKMTVTTAANTTTMTRTTRSADTPTPTSIDGDTLTVGGYTVKIPYGYVIYSSSTTNPIIVNNSKKIQIGLAYNTRYEYSYIKSNPNVAYTDIQRQGFEISDAVVLTSPSRKNEYIVFTLESSRIPTGYNYYFAITSVGRGTFQAAMLVDEDRQLTDAMNDFDEMVKSLDSSSSSFAPSEDADKDIDTSTFDSFDERLFQ